ncbi:MAG TPA: alpha/beta fold hydrolase [Pyrinomonadaceae bacterium]|jgi:pimeloyl-ACP methyl ester carboxylesterase
MSLQTQRERTALAFGAMLRFASVLAILFTLTSAAFAQESSRSIKVERVNFPVTLSDGKTYTVAGYLYYQGSYRNRTLLLALHGANYNHNYWDVPRINGHDYSFARYMAAQKYAVLAIDQLGTGASDKPDGDLLTLGETASATHQIISGLRAGAGDIRHPFERVVLVGHSLGSINALYEQATYADADAVIITGMGHVAHKLPIPDPVIEEMLKSKYFPFPDNLRAELFYYAPGADPDVIAYDRDHLSELLPRAQLVTGVFAAFNPEANRVGAVTGPVLVQLGEHDALFPASLADGEAAFYQSASSVTVQAIPGVGHDVNTHYGNHASWRLMEEWLRSAGLHKPDAN